MKHVSFLCIIPLLIVSTSLQAITQRAHLNKSWYPNTQESLQATMLALSEKATQRYNAKLDSTAIKAIIVPHAGYAYSGAVAASVYRLCDKHTINKVIILAPDHSVSFEGVALPAFDSYQTPLGTLNIDKTCVQNLARNRLFHGDSKVFEHEHSLEVQLPFIQTYLHNHITIVPLLVGKITCKQALIIASTLQPCIDKNTLVVVSTDFVHYGKRFNFTPFQDNVALNIRALDSQAVESIGQGTCATFTNFMQQTNATICGYYPLKIFLSLLELTAFGAIEPRLIAYDSSGQQEKAAENSVSYIGMLFTQQRLDSMPLEDQLTQEEKHALAQEAHDVLNNLFNPTIDQKLLYPIKSFGITQPFGAFVTLEKKTANNKELRGCIGRITTRDPLYKTVAIVTRDTALHDTRFTPVEKKELPELSLKISVLSPTRPIASYKDIVLGKHGVIMQHGNHSAVFLPEVPLEFKWNLEEMLAHLSKKAGLAKNAWQENSTKFKVFTTLAIE